VNKNLIETRRGNVASICSFQLVRDLWRAYFKAA